MININVTYCHVGHKMTRKCVICGNEFKANRRAKTCSKYCSKKLGRKRKLRWYHGNKEKANKWKTQNPGYSKEWYRNNIKKEKARSRKWYINNLTRKKEKKIKKIINNLKRKDNPILPRGSQNNKLESELKKNIP